jgi:hypothetical protein
VLGQAYYEIKPFKKENLKMQNKKKTNEMTKTYLRYILLLFLGATAISAVILVFAMTVGAKSVNGSNPVANAEELPPTENSQPVITTAIPEQLGYIMREYEGEVAIFREGSNSPYQILDYPVYLLGEEEQEEVKVGIRVDTFEEIRKLVEDFCG